MKHIKKISCKTCIRFHACQAIECNPECWMGKKTTSMEEKITQREEIAAWRKKIHKMYNM